MKKIAECIEVLRELEFMLLIKVNPKKFMIVFMDGRRTLFYEDLQNATNEMSIIFSKSRDELLKSLFSCSFCKNKLV